MDLIRIGQYIAGKRKALGLTQKQLAEKLGVSDKSVSKWERGYVCRTCRSIRSCVRRWASASTNSFRAMISRENDLPRRAEENILQTAADGKRRQKRLKCMVAALLIVSAAALSIIGAYLIRTNRPENVTAPWKMKARRCRRSSSSPVWTEPICTAIQPRTIFSPCVYI